MEWFQTQICFALHNTQFTNSEFIAFCGCAAQHAPLGACFAFGLAKFDCFEYFLNPHIKMGNNNNNYFNASDKIPAVPIFPHQLILFPIKIVGFDEQKNPFILSHVSSLFSLCWEFLWNRLLRVHNALFPEMNLNTVSKDCTEKLQFHLATAAIVYTNDER